MTIRHAVSLTIWNTGEYHLQGQQGITQAPCLTQSSLSYPSRQLLFPKEASAKAYVYVNSSHSQILSGNSGWYIGYNKYVAYIENS